MNLLDFFSLFRFKNKMLLILTVLVFIFVSGFCNELGSTISSNSSSQWSHLFWNISSNATVSPHFLSAERGSSFSTPKVDNPSLRPYARFGNFNAYLLAKAESLKTSSDVSQETTESIKLTSQDSTIPVYTIPGQQPGMREFHTVGQNSGTENAANLSNMTSHLRVQRDDMFLPKFSDSNLTSFTESSIDQSANNTASNLLFSPRDGLFHDFANISEGTNQTSDLHYHSQEGFNNSTVNATNVNNTTNEENMNLIIDEYGKWLLDGYLRECLQYVNTTRCRILLHAIEATVIALKSTGWTLKAPELDFRKVSLARSLDVPLNDRVVNPHINFTTESDESESTPESFSGDRISSNTTTGNFPEMAASSSATADNFTEFATSGNGKIENVTEMAASSNATADSVTEMTSSGNVTAGNVTEMTSFGNVTAGNVTERTSSGNVTAGNVTEITSSGNTTTGSLTEIISGNATTGSLTKVLSGNATAENFTDSLWAIRSNATSGSLTDDLWNITVLSNKSTNLTDGNRTIEVFDDKFNGTRVLYPQEFVSDGHIYLCHFTAEEYNRYQWQHSYHSNQNYRFEKNFNKNEQSFSEEMYGKLKEPNHQSSHHKQPGQHMEQIHRYPGQNVEQIHRYPGQNVEQIHRYPGQNVEQIHRYPGQNVEQIHRYPGQNVEQIHRYPGQNVEQIHRYPGQNVEHIHRYPGQNVEHIHRYPGQNVEHIHRYPGQKVEHIHLYPGQNEEQINRYPAQNVEQIGHGNRFLGQDMELANWYSDLNLKQNSRYPDKYSENDKYPGLNKDPLKNLEQDFNQLEIPYRHAPRSFDIDTQSSDNLNGNSSVETNVHSRSRSNDQKYSETQEPVYYRSVDGEIMNETGFLVNNASNHTVKARGHKNEPHEKPYQTSPPAVYRSNKEYIVNETETPVHKMDHLIGRSNNQEYTESQPVGYYRDFDKISNETGNFVNAASNHTHNASCYDESTEKPNHKTAHPVVYSRSYANETVYESGEINFKGRGNHPYEHTTPESNAYYRSNEKIFNETELISDNLLVNDSGKVDFKGRGNHPYEPTTPESNAYYRSNEKISNETGYLLGNTFNETNLRGHHEITDHSISTRLNDETPEKDFPMNMSSKVNYTNKTTNNYSIPKHVDSENKSGYSTDDTLDSDDHKLQARSLNETAIKSQPNSAITPFAVGGGTSEFNITNFQTNVHLEISAAPNTTAGTSAMPRNAQTHLNSTEHAQNANDTMPQTGNAPNTSESAVNEPLVTSNSSTFELTTPAENSSLINDMNAVFLNSTLEPGNKSINSTVGDFHQIFQYNEGSGLENPRPVAFPPIVLDEIEDEIEEIPLHVMNMDDMQKCYFNEECNFRLNEICVHDEYVHYCGCSKGNRRHPITNVCQAKPSSYPGSFDRYKRNVDDEIKMERIVQEVSPPQPEVSCDTKMCSGHGQCFISHDNVTACSCINWYFGKRCHIDAMIAVMSVLAGMCSLTAVALALSAVCCWFRRAHAKRWIAVPQRD